MEDICTDQSKDTNDANSHESSLSVDKSSKIFRKVAVMEFLQLEKDVVMEENSHELPVDIKDRIIIENTSPVVKNSSIDNKVESPLQQNLSALKNRTANETIEKVYENKSNNNPLNNIQRKRFKCPYCDYSGRDRFRMKEHMEGVHLGIKNHKCGHCEYTASSFKSVKRHIAAIHQKVKNYKCKLCEYAAGSGEHLRRHVRAVHYRIKKRKCEYCGYMTSHNDALNRHIDSVHHKDKISSQKLIENYTCELCDYVFMNYASLKRHILTAHRGIENEVRESMENTWDLEELIDLDDKVDSEGAPLMDQIGFGGSKPKPEERLKDVIHDENLDGFDEATADTTKIELQVEAPLLKNDEQVQEEYFVTNEVGYEQVVFIKKEEIELEHSTMDDNISTEINEDRPEIKRELSSLNYSDSEGEDEGSQNENSDAMNETKYADKIDDTPSKDPQSKKISCKFCDYAGRSRSRIRDHMNAVHLGIKNHKCQYCDYAASQFHYIKRHIQIVHQKIKNHKCEFCDYSTNNIAHVKRHVATVHQKIKCHECKYCRFTATRADNLKQHVQIVHLNNKNYRKRQGDYAASTSGSVQNEQSQCFIDTL